MMSEGCDWLIAVLVQEHNVGSRNMSYLAKSHCALNDIDHLVFIHRKKTKKRRLESPQRRTKLPHRETSTSISCQVFQREKTASTTYFWPFPHIILLGSISVRQCPSFICYWTGRNVQYIFYIDHTESCNMGYIKNELLLIVLLLATNWLNR